MKVENYIPMFVLIFFFLNIVKGMREPSDLLQKRMTSLEITNYSSFCDTDEQQQNIWVNREQLDEKQHY